MSAQVTLNFAMVGLGRMGANIVRRLARQEITSVVYDINPQAISELAKEGAVPATDFADLVRKLPAPRVVWVMVPAGVTDSTIAAVAEHLSAGDTVIDGGNSFYRNDLTNAEKLAAQGINFIDVGTSGGVYGLERGYSLMIGGDKAVVAQLDPIFRALASGVAAAGRTPGRIGEPTTSENGYLHCGPVGAGHYVKMIHNGIEYGMMAALAEGLAILEAARDANPSYDLNIPEITEVWRRGSVVASWLLDLTAQALQENPTLEGYSAEVSDSGEGRWSVQAAVESGVPVPVLKNLLDELHLIVGDYRSLETFAQLRDALSVFALPVIYLAIAPDMFATVTQGLAEVGITKNARIVVEKPFGRDLPSAIALDNSLKKILPEDQIYRIDHYLGKESVEDLLVFRFANTLFEPVWNRNYISSVQITMSESFGIEGRGKFYGEAGATRDVLQNHLMQVLTMLAMEPPIGLSSQSMQDEKIKVLSAVRDLQPADVVRGQYVGYLEEDGVVEHSDTETFVAMRLFIDNWRWEGVPFYLRTGKKMVETTMEAVIEFKQPPRLLFTIAGTAKPLPNIVRFRLGVRDGVDISLQAKAPGPALVTYPVDLTVEFAAALGERKEAYERLLDAALEGDHFRFTRIDAVLQSWQVLDPILKSPTKLHPYFAHSWGPDEALDLVPGGWNIVGKEASKHPCQK